MWAIGSQASSDGPYSYHRIRYNNSPTSAYLCFFDLLMRWLNILYITKSSVSLLSFVSLWSVLFLVVARECLSELLEIFAFRDPSTCMHPRVDQLDSSIRHPAMMSGFW